MEEVSSNWTEEISSNHEEFRPPDLLYTLMGIWALLTGTSGCFANLLAIFLFMVTPKLRSPMNYLLINLSICELIISITGNWVLAANSFYRELLLSPMLCKANAFGMTFVGIISIVTLAVLAVQRFMMITQDRQFPLSTDISTVATMLFIWLYTFLISSPPIFGWGEFGLNSLKVSCGVIWDVTKTMDSKKMAFIGYIYVLGFIIPLMVIVFCYSKIINAVKASGMSCQFENDAKRKSKIRRDRKLTTMVALMLGGYIMTWFPYACVSIAETAGYKPYNTMTYYIHAIPTILTKMCVCLDPLIYLGFNPQFLNELLKFLGHERRQGHESTNQPNTMTISSKDSQRNLVKSNTFQMSRSVSRLVEITEHL